MDEEELSEIFLPSNNKYINNEIMHIIRLYFIY